MVIFFFNDTATTEIYTLSLHDALPISSVWKSSTRGSIWMGVGEPWPRTETCCSRPLLASVDTRRDRKSTRLNSSHANISYAVFCLKKKQTMIDLNRTSATVHNTTLHIL